MSAHPVSSEVLALLHQAVQEAIATHKRSVRIGVAGAQGSGKSTLVKAYAAAHPRTAFFSMDDVYLSTAERKDLAAKHSPLLKTRGPAGTHDLALATRVIRQLEAALPRDRTPLPRFNKLTDAPLKPADWPQFEGKPNVILVDGWCMGATPEDEAALAVPENALEEHEDSDGRWRGFVNAQLAGPYAAFFARMDVIITLESPGWHVVPRWRMEQEAHDRGLTVETLPPEVKTNLARFMLHYERVTRHMLAGGRRSDWTVALDEDRTPMEIRQGL